MMTNWVRFSQTSTWTDRQVLALHFAERLSAWEIHVVLNLSMSDVLCRIQRLRRIAQGFNEGSTRRCTTIIAEIVTRKRCVN